MLPMGLLARSEPSQPVADDALCSVPQHEEVRGTRCLTSEQHAALATHLGLTIVA